MRRSQTTAAIPECQLQPAMSRVCSNPHIEAGGRCLDQSRSKSERHLTLSSVEDLTEHDSHAEHGQALLQQREATASVPWAAQSKLCVVAAIERFFNVALFVETSAP